MIIKNKIKRMKKSIFLCRYDLLSYIIILVLVFLRININNNDISYFAQVSISISILTSYILIIIGLATCYLVFIAILNKTAAFTSIVNLNRRVKINIGFNIKILLSVVVYFYLNNIYHYNIVFALMISGMITSIYIFSKYIYYIVFNYIQLIKFETSINSEFPKLKGIDIPVEELLFDNICNYLRTNFTDAQHKINILKLQNIILESIIDKNIYRIKNKKEEKKYIFNKIKYIQENKNDLGNEITGLIIDYYVKKYWKGDNPEDEEDKELYKWMQFNVVENSKSSTIYNILYWMESHIKKEDETVEKFIKEKITGIIPISFAKNIKKEIDSGETDIKYLKAQCETFKSELNKWRKINILLYYSVCENWVDGIKELMEVLTQENIIEHTLYGTFSDLKYLVMIEGIINAYTYSKNTSLHIKKIKNKLKKVIERSKQLLEINFNLENIRAILGLKEYYETILTEVLWKRDKGYDIDFSKNKSIIANNLSMDIVEKIVITYLDHYYNCTPDRIDEIFDDKYFGVIETEYRIILAIYVINTLNSRKEKIYNKEKLEFTDDFLNRLPKLVEFTNKLYKYKNFINNLLNDKHEDFPSLFNLIRRNFYYKLNDQIIFLITKLCIDNEMQYRYTPDEFKKLISNYKNGYFSNKHSLEVIKISKHDKKNEQLEEIFMYIYINDEVVV